MTQRPALICGQPKEETFQPPLKYIDVTRTTHTNLDVLQEKRIDDNWNVDVSRHLSDSWTRFTKFTILNEKLPKGHVVREAACKDSRQLPDLITCGQKFGPACHKQLNERKSSNEASILSIRMIKSSRKPVKTQGKSCKSQWKPLCLVS